MRGRGGDRRRGRYEEGGRGYGGGEGGRGLGGVGDLGEGEGGEGSRREGRRRGRVRWGADEVVGQGEYVSVIWDWVQLPATNHTAIPPHPNTPPLHCPTARQGEPQDAAGDGDARLQVRQVPGGTAAGAGGGGGGQRAGSGGLVKIPAQTKPKPNETREMGGGGVQWTRWWGGLVMVGCRGWGASGGGDEESQLRQPG